MKLPIRYSLFYIFIALFVSLAASMPSAAKIPPKPLWVENGVKSLNDKRISHDYHFVAFNHKLTDENVVNTGKIHLMRENMAEELGVDPKLITIDSITQDNTPTLYSITFPSPNSQEFSRVYVKEVDSYKRYYDNIDGSFDYELDELYAISEADITPVFDNFEVTRKYNGIPVAMSLIPGLGQIYKGQKAKGFAILGAEVVFCTTIAFGEIYRNYYLKKGRENPDFYDSWKRKSDNYRTLRNVGIVLASATYIYNILDAALAKGAPHVVISRSNDAPMDLVFYPEASPFHLGAAISITF